MAQQVRPAGRSPARILVALPVALGLFTPGLAAAPGDVLATMPLPASVTSALGIATGCAGRHSPASSS